MTTQGLSVARRYLPGRLTPGRGKMARAVRRDAGGRVSGLAIVFVSLVFRGLIPAPTWVWLVVLAVGVLLAVKDGISRLDVITLALAGFMIVRSLSSVASTG